MLNRSRKCYFLLLLSPIIAQAADFYCPQNHGYIALGMTQEQVIGACGQPEIKEKLKKPFERKIPLLQLVYNNLGSAKAFYGVWTLPTGLTPGATLEVDVVDDKVRSVRLNGGSDKAFSVCGGTPIIEGDPVSKVYTSCGEPSVINNSYLLEPVSATSLPEVWSYTADYQPTIRLTFVNGVLVEVK